MGSNRLESAALRLLSSEAHTDLPTDSRQVDTAAVLEALLDRSRAASSEDQSRTGSSKAMVARLARIRAD